MEEITPTTSITAIRATIMVVTDTIVRITGMEGTGLNTEVIETTTAPIGTAGTGMGTGNTGTTIVTAITKSINGNGTEAIAITAAILAASCWTEMETTGDATVSASAGAEFSPV